MKLRLRENSVRLRLLKSEVVQLKEIGFVNERIQFSESEFLQYSIAIDENADEVSAVFKNKELAVKIPGDEAKDWIDTEKVGIEHIKKIDEQSSLNILIEKDFVCLTRPMEGDNLDAFPNPEAQEC